MRVQTVIGRLRALWHGEVKLWKAFWLFGIALQIIFSFVFFKLNLLSVFNKPKVFLPIDLSLLAAFIIYGIFIVIPIWKSGKKYQGARTWRYLSRLAAILVVLWFGANIGMYVFMRQFAATPLFKDWLKSTPEKLKLSNSDGNSGVLYLGKMKLKFLFNKKNMRGSSPSFYEPNLNSIYIRLKKSEGEIMFNDESFFDSVIPKESSTQKVLDWLLNTRFGLPNEYKSRHEILYSRPEDYSWWNLRKNFRLVLVLLIKNMTRVVGQSVVYDIETPYLKGFLMYDRVYKKSYSVDFQYASYSLTVTTKDKKIVDRFLSMLGTIQPITDKGQAIKETKAMLAQKDQSPYPEDLLLCSLMSLKVPDVKSLKELRRLAESRHDMFDVNSIDEEIKYLSSRRENKGVVKGRVE